LYASREKHICTYLLGSSDILNRAAQACAHGFLETWNVYMSMSCCWDLVIYSEPPFVSHFKASFTIPQRHGSTGSYAWSMGLPDNVGSRKLPGGGHRMGTGALNWRETAWGRAAAWKVKRVFYKLADWTDVEARHVGQCTKLGQFG
jgi:hypothetical protein